ncbi:MAG: hypothetical protein WD030_02305, partial [Pirellulales bacterium]
RKSRGSRRCVVSSSIGKRQFIEALRPSDFYQWLALTQQVYHGRANFSELYVSAVFGWILP